MWESNGPCPSCAEKDAELRKAADSSLEWNALVVKLEEENKRLREAGDWMANQILQYRVTTPEYQDARLLVNEYDRRRAKEG